MNFSIRDNQRLAPLTRLPLVIKISALLAVMLCLSLVITSTLFEREMRDYRHAQQDQLAELLGQQTADIAATQILARDWVSLTVGANQLSQLPLVSGVEIVGTKQEPLAQAGSYGERVHNTAIELNGSALGEVRIHLNDQSLAGLSIAFYRTTLAAIITCFAVWLVLFAYIRRLHPLLRQLVAATDAISHDHEMPRLRCHRQDELGRICDHLNQRFAPPEPEPAVPQDIEASEQPMSTVDSLTDLSAQADAQKANMLGLNDSGVTAPPPTIERHYLLYVDHCSTASENFTAEEREQLLTPYQQVLEQVSELYRGRFALDENGNWWVGFSPLDAEQGHGINALCAAKLFNALYRGINQRAISRMSPVVNIKMALMSGDESFPSLLEEAESLCRSVEANELIVDESIFQIASLSRLLEQAESRRLEQPARLLTQLAPNYQTLIDQQAEHFLNQS